MPEKPIMRRKIGDIGENIACEFLVKRGFRIMKRNYLRKWGEIDIIAEKAEVLHFVEVKSVRLEQGREVAHATLNKQYTSNNKQADTYRPEENMHPRKLKRLSRVIQTYLLESASQSGGEKEWQLDLVTVSLNMKDRIGHCEIIENIVI